MPISSLLKFLHDPCLRLTPSFCQNDPFEFGYSLEDLMKLNSVSATKTLGKDLKSYANLHGIISLSYTHKDILMWSHYADEHRGAVVELHVDENNPLAHFAHSISKNCHPTLFDNALFNKVNYQKDRNFAHNITDLERVKHHYYFTKAKPWKYEQEYRFILPAILANRIVLNQEGIAKANKISEDLLGEKRFHIKESNADENYVLDTHGFDHDFLLELWRQSQGNDIMFFIGLNSGMPGRNTGCIGKIYLGCKADEEKLTSEFLNDPHSLFGIHHFYYSQKVLMNEGNIVTQGIDKAIIDKNEYKLEFEDLSR